MINKMPEKIKQTNDQMNVTFYGVRGGQPAPSREHEGFYTSKYGGNTTHLLLKYNDEYNFIDGGTGISVCSDYLMSQEIGTDKKPINARLLLTHFHSDHTDGLLFCGILHNPNNEFDVYGRDTAEVVEQILAKNQHEKRFPVSYTVGEDKRPSFRAKRNHHNVYEINQNGNGSLRISATPTTHPGGCVAYRFATPNGKTFVFGGDHEFGLDTVVDDNLHYFCKEADIIVMDTQYTPEEYPERVNWGHSSYDRVIDFALKSRVKKLVMTHFDRSRDDEGCDRFYEHALNYLKNKQGENGKLELLIAREGMSLVL